MRLQNTLKRVITVVITITLVLSSTFAQADTYFFHNDHLGTPQVLTDKHQAVVWETTNEPFGSATETTKVVEQNLRFPGQYLDRETGLHYNYFRTYDPLTGRYLESDPIGLLGGINTYGYTYQNPIRYTDPTGEAVPLLPTFYYGLTFAWGLFEIAGSAYDVYDTATTFADECSTTSDKLLSGTLLAAGIFGPGSGYSSFKHVTKKTALPDSYWINKKAPTQVTPGTRTVNNPAKPSSSGGTYPSTTHYDQFGRQIGQTHRTSHGRPADHPNPHHHRRDPTTGEKLKTPDGSRIWPGLFGN